MLKTKLSISHDLCVGIPIYSLHTPLLCLGKDFGTNSVLRVACECESSSTGTFNKDCDYETSGFVASSNRYAHDVWYLTDTPMICVVVRGCGDGGNTLHGDWPESGGGSSVMWSCSASGHPGPHTAASHTGWGGRHVGDVWPDGQNGG